ncbi:MAG: response regulator [Candidatus Xenobiia bacterium LiM19]
MDRSVKHVLLIDDDPVQRTFILMLLRAECADHFRLSAVLSLAEGCSMMKEDPADVVLLDLSLPDSCREETFQNFHSQFPDAPIVVMTGHKDEETGIHLLKSGAQDYLIKGQVNGPLLCRSLRYAIERKRLTLELMKTVADLKEALAEVKTLSNLLPICTYCKKIRDDKGYWQSLEKYFFEHSEMRFSHGLCPECIEKYYPDYNSD